MRVGPPVGVGELAFSPDEVHQLWWFRDGTMMAPEVRAELRRGWGFCPRPAWAHAAIECELRGGRPFATSILYEDLTRRAATVTARAMRAPGTTLLIRRLRGKPACATCEHLRMVAGLAGRPRPGLDSEGLASRAAVVSRFDRVWPLLLQVEPVWRDRACPACLGGHGIVCRQHLLQGAEPVRDLGRQLLELADRLSAFVNSMTWRGTPASPLASASWVEALSWFSGWDFPDRLVAAHTGPG